MVCMQIEFVIVTFLARRAAYLFIVDIRINKTNKCQNIVRDMVRKSATQSRI